MKKFVKFFSVLATILMIATPFAGAVWPPEGCSLVAPRYREDELRGDFRRAVALGMPAATYCFFDPDAAETFFHPADYMASPIPDKSLEDIPVAICLQNPESVRVFKRYFIDKNSEPISTSPVSLTHDAENVFIISFADLNELSRKIALYTKNGILGKPSLRDKNWSWKNVIYNSRLSAAWVGAEISAPEFIYCLKVRVLMNGLSAAGYGETIRVVKADSMTEAIWYRGKCWGRDIVN